MSTPSPFGEHDEQEETPVVNGPPIPVSVNVDPEAVGVGDRITHERTNDSKEEVE